MLRRTPATLEQRVVLSGSDATTWLAERGFVTTAAALGYRLFADAYRAPDIALARVLRDPGETRHGGSTTPAVSVSAVTDGALEIVSRAGRMRVGRGQAIVTSAMRTHTTTNTGPVSTIEIELGELFTSRFGRIAERGPQIIDDDLPRIRALSALVNEVLTHAPEMSIPLAGGYRIAIEALVSDLFDDVGVDLPASLSASDRYLIDKARRVIRACFADSAFSVTVLATELAVSERRLQRAFSSIESTPTASLRRARVDAAHKILQTYPVVTRVELDLVARQVGLPGARALKDHFAAFGVRIPRYGP